jgi:two-component system nitrate/nitrite response regulator NarL
MTKGYSIAIVDDHFAVRDGYKYFLEKLNLVEYVACFSGEKDIIEELEKSHFDLVLLDIELREGNGIKICRNLKLKFKNTKVLILSGHHNKEYIISAYQNDSDGYLFKDSENEEVKFAVERVLLKEEKHFNLEAMDTIFQHQEFYKNQIKNTKKILSEREIEIVKLICEGKSNKEIGNILYRDETTISTHRYNIMKKIGAHKSLEILNYAISVGIYLPIKKSN